MAATMILSGLQYTVGEKNSVTAAAWVNGAATAGVAVPARGRGEYSHLIADKNAALTVSIWGLATGYGNWVKCDSITFAQTNAAEAQPVRVIAAFERVQTVVDSIGASGAANFFWAFSGE